MNTFPFISVPAEETEDETSSPASELLSAVPWFLASNMTSGLVLMVLIWLKNKTVSRSDLASEVENISLGCGSVPAVLKLLHGSLQVVLCGVMRSVFEAL